MQVSQKGIDALKFSEGVRLRSYQDSVGVWTIGVGHTKTARPSMEITSEQAEKLLRGDLAWVETAIEKYVRVDLTQNQYDAIVNFVFNVGEGAFKKSTLLHKLNTGDTQGAADEFLRWTRAGNTHPPGLVSRRQRERDMFLGTDNENAQAADPDMPDLGMPLVRYGDSGPAVEFLRLFLIERGYDDGNILRGTFGMVFGGNMADSVRAFQHDNGIVADGIVGRNTWQHVASELADVSG